MEKELRYNSISLRKDEQSRIIEGRAIVFNDNSADLGWIERILPTAITEDTIKNSDIFCLYNHNQDAVLGRSNHGNGSLALSVNEDGVDFMVEAPNTRVGDDVLELLKRGDLSGCSFAFTIPKGGDKWYRDKEGIMHRDISAIDALYDVSIVNTPAYPTTTVSAREKMKSNLDLFAKLDAMEDELNNI